MDQQQKVKERVAASVVAGVFTFGMDTTISLGITAVASTLTGVRNCCGHRLCCKDFAQVEKAFIQLGKTFDYVAGIASNLKLSCVVKVKQTNCELWFVHFSSLYTCYLIHYSEYKLVTYINLLSFVLPSFHSSILIITIIFL